MAKNKRKPPPKKYVPATKSAAHEAARLIGSGRIKEGFKAAQEAYKEKQTPEHHLLLERAYFARLEQLRRESMTASAAELARQLLAFGLTAPDLIQKMTAILVDLGLSAEAFALADRAEQPEIKSALLPIAADNAVIRLDRAPTGPPELHEGAVLVRKALSAIDAGDEPGALEALRDIPRNSPFADWRYFVRGLVALRRGDMEQVTANWGRLESSRVARRLAAALCPGILPAAAQPFEEQQTKERKGLEAAVFGAAISELFGQLHELIAEDAFEESIPVLQLLYPRLRNVDPRLAERLTRILIWNAMSTALELSPRESRQFLSAFTRASHPLPLDPHWNRFRALVAEADAAERNDAAGPDASADVERYWSAYLEDLETLPSLAPAQRRRAQALVAERLGDWYAVEIDSAPGNPFGFMETKSATSAPRDRQKAERFLKQSITLAPDRLDARETLLHAYEQWGDHRHALETATSLLEALPDHFETLVWITHYYRKLDQPALALPYILRARTLKPLDDHVRQLEWLIRISLARHLAVEGRWDEGRAEFDRAEPLWPDASSGFSFFARKAVFELKAGQPDIAQKYIDAGAKTLEEDTPLWLQLVIDARRYQLPKSEVDRFNEKWQAGLCRKGKSATLGQLAEILAGYLANDIEYVGRELHIHEVYEFIRRSSRVKIRCEDYIKICGFLNFISAARETLGKFISRGVKSFPDSASLQVSAGMLELGKGPLHADLGIAERHLQKGLKLAQASNNPEDEKLLAMTKNLLQVVQSLARVSFRSPFAAFSNLPGGRDFFEEMITFIDSEDDEDPTEHPFGSGFPGRKPGAAGRKASPRARKSPAKKNPPKKKG